ncbi:MBL fold metallo-hydrolase [Ornithinimicrobium sp. F0845]|uniref:MBL fold metallo-hydrolase n=1 Tax=Ornithinimicrobium sp. F0845 TaxID=2926412 RepID=UPI001FF17640|nr:MBL fold metallo-hydrolase [Ornithinimicrobium sp. F0845]MCK0114089.1 MBL fold metallo-hydrolase [Ornithinimicrobium sp. F0845]
MQITHLGHSCVLLEVADQRILIDPGTLSDFADVRDLTAVVGTHQHPDHVDPARLATLLSANPGARVLLEGQTAAAVTEAAGDHAERLESMSSGTDILLGPVSLSPVGQRHAVIHDYVPRIDNTGVVVRAEGEPSVFHPGDALDAEPGPVDVLLVPLSAPWARVSDTVEFARRIAPARAVPIHDGLLNDNGRPTYLRHLTDFGADGGLEVLDLRGAGATAL